MLRYLNKVLAFVLALTMMVGVTACGEQQESKQETEKEKPLVVGYPEFSGNFSPYTASLQYDTTPPIPWQKEYGTGCFAYAEQLLSFQTSLIGLGNGSYYLCPEEFTFWENEEQKLQEMFPRYTFKIVLDWVYSHTGDLWSGKKVSSNVDNLEHHPFPHPFERDTLAGCVALGNDVTLDMFVKYWNRYVSKCDSLKMIMLEHPNMDSLDINVPTDFKVEAIQIRGGNNLVDISGASKYLIGNKEVTYNLNGFTEFGSRRSNGVDIKEEFKQNPVFERATNGVLSLDNLTYLFDNSSDGLSLFSYFTYNLNTGMGKLFNTAYNKKLYSPRTIWFDKDGFKPAVDILLKK